MKIFNYNILFFETIDSTNDYLYRRVQNNNLNNNLLVISKKQTNGHGNYNRTFASNENGIYFSLLLFSDDDIKLLTPKVSISIYEIFLENYDIKLDIKWINDLFKNNKKVVGILCKHLLKEKCYIIGVGIDLYKNIYEDICLNRIIGYIFETKKKKSNEIKLVIDIVNRIILNIDKELSEVYFNNNIVLNKIFLYDNQQFKVININKDGYLVAKNLKTNIEQVFVSSEGIKYEQ